MKKNIYLAGKVKTDNYKGREGGWRYHLLKELFGVDVEVGMIDNDNHYYQPPTTSINERFNYVGPYLYGCDHGCSHSLDYAHGLLTCSDMPNNKPNYEILDISLNQIRITDIFIANFNEMPLDAYGMIAEIGYASAKNKKIFGIGPAIRELWFVQGMCDMYDNIDELRTAILAYDKAFCIPVALNPIETTWDCKH